MKKKIKVLQVNKFYYPVIGGIEKTVQQIAEGLNSDIFDVSVLTCTEKRFTKTELVNGIKVIRTGSFGVWFSLPISASFLLKLKQLSGTMDIIQFHMPFPLGDLGALISGYRGKIVVWWHSDIVRQQKWMTIYRPVLNRFLKRADWIIVATKGTILASDVLSKYQEKCRIIPFGISEKFWKISELAIQKKYQESISVNRKPVQFLFVGRLVYYKGCEILLKAFRQVKDAALIMIGDGPMRSELEKDINRYHLQEKVTMLRQVTDDVLHASYERCDVFVLPSTLKSEAFGLVQLEAMAYEKPVINTKLPGGVTYVSLDRITGLTVEPGKVEELADAMNWMVEHPQERLNMGRKARRRVEEEFSEEKMLGMLQHLYHEVTGI